MSRIQITRRDVLVSALAAPLLMTPALAQRERPDALEAEAVKDFVIAGHGNLDKVKEMLKATPGLLNATWDWGGGDFESALGGAGHMGRHDIADYLIGEGARADIFIHTMQGDLDVVKSMLGKYPNLKDSKGPHGIPLKTHAEKGGEASKEVLDYLEGF
jgi:hypothetical protein